MKQCGVSILEIWTPATYKADEVNWIVRPVTDSYDLNVYGSHFYVVKIIVNLPAKMPKE